jgi:hypothetical protein
MKVNLLNRKLSLTIADLLHYFLAKALKSFADLHSCGARDLVHLPGRRHIAQRQRGAVAADSRRQACIAMPKAAMPLRFH